MSFDIEKDRLTTAERVLLAICNKEQISPNMEPLMRNDDSQVPVYSHNNNNNNNGWSSFEQHFLQGSMRVAVHDPNGNYMGDFGYIRVNGRWVDPDDEAQINAAHHNLPDPRLPVEGTIKNRAELFLGAWSEAPEDTNLFFYEEFARKLDLVNEMFAEVSDDEGDPRDSRISPERFLEIATAGPSVEHKRENPNTTSQDIMQSVSGNASNHFLRMTDHNPVTARKHIAESIDETTRVVRPEDKSDELPKEHLVERQYDEHTGEELSPKYSVDSFPIPLMSPQGVNMARLPSSFAKSYPAHFRHFKASAAEPADLPVMTEQSEDDLLRGAEAAEVPDHGEKFTQNGVVEALNGNKFSGFERTIARLEEAEKGRILARATLERYNVHHQNLVESNEHLRREVGRLRAHQVVAEAAKARHLQQVQSRFSEIAEDVSYAKQATQNLRKENHLLAKENSELLEEYQKLLGKGKEV